MQPRRYDYFSAIVKKSGSLMVIGRHWKPRLPKIMRRQYPSARLFRPVNGYVPVVGNNVPEDCYVAAD